MKVDINGHERRYKNWKSEMEEAPLISGITPESSKIIVQYIFDMEEGRNVAKGSRKGGRSYARLNNLKQRMIQVTKMLQEREGVKDITKLKEKQITKFFSDMRRGELKTSTGEKYKSVGDYVKNWKAFWNWWIKINRKEGIGIPNIMEDIDTSPLETPKFVWIKKEQLDKMLPYFSEKEQMVLMFLFDSVMRAPTEVLSLKVSDIYEKDDEVWVSVRDEISKTFGREFNLLYCGRALKDYIKKNDLQPDDFLFDFSPPYLNRKLKLVAEKLFGEGKPHPKCDYYKHLNLYDFRHSGLIHFRLLAKDNPKDVSLDSIRHRAGHTKFDMLNYYTQFLGMDGKIQKVGLMLKKERNELEEKLDIQNQLLKLVINKDKYSKKEFMEKTKWLLSQSQEID